MTINKLGSVDPISSYHKIEKNSKVAQKGQADSVNLSQEAKKNAELMQVLDAVQSSPDLRFDKIEDAKLKLQDSSYIDDKVLNQVADNIMDVFGL